MLIVMRRLSNCTSRLFVWWYRKDPRCLWDRVFKRSGPFYQSSYKHSRRHFVVVCLPMIVAKKIKHPSCSTSHGPTVYTGIWRGLEDSVTSIWHYSFKTYLRSLAVRHWWSGLALRHQGEAWLQRSRWVVCCQIPRRGLVVGIEMSALLSETKERPGCRDPDEWYVVRHQGEAWL